MSEQRSPGSILSNSEHLLRLEAGPVLHGRVSCGNIVLESLDTVADGNSEETRGLDAVGENQVITSSTDETGNVWDGEVVGVVVVLVASDSAKVTIRISQMHTIFQKS